MGEMIENNVQHWEDLSVKDKAAMITAVASFVLGFVLLFMGMFIGNEGEIDGSVLTAFGTCLLYTAGIFGVAMYFKTGNSELMNKVIDAMDKRIERKLKEREDEGSE